MSSAETAPASARAFPAVSIEQAHALLTQPGSLFEIEEEQVRGATLKVWKSAPPTLKHVYALSALYAGREHVAFEDERASFAGVRKAAAALAQRLVLDGIRPGDRVGLIMRNLPEWPAAFWSCVLAGAIVTPLNAWWTGSELEFAIQDSGAKILIVDNERYERVREHLPRSALVQRTYVSRAPEEIADPAVTRLESVIGAVNAWAELADVAAPAHEPNPDDDVAIFYTSGTTGKPKGAVLTHRNIVSNIWNSAFAQARAFVRRGERPPAPDPSAPQKVFLVSVPFFHATGCCAAMCVAFLGGHKIVLQRRWDVDTALPLIERERITHFGGVPTIAWQVLEHADSGKYDLSSVESIGYGGAPAAPELVRRVKERFPDSIPSQGWGMTETAAVATNNVAEDYLRKPGSCGVPPPSGEAKIVLTNGAEAPRGEVGELWYKGPVVARGYWNNPEASAETFQDGWVKTGDLAKMDEEGFIYIVDRAKDMLIRGGENIYCVEVENAMFAHDAVMDAAVIGRAHPSLGEEPVAVVHLKPGAQASAEDLRHHAAQTLAAFKVPVEVIFWPENLPRNANGKIVKKDLKRMLESRN